MFKVENLPTPVQRHFSGLWRRRWRVVAIVWGVAVLVWFAIWLIPNSYESRAHVYVEIDVGVEAPGARAYYQERIDAMRFQLLTRPLLTKIASFAGLDDSFENQAARERLTKNLSERISIESPSAMYLVISYRDRDPDVARAVVDAVTRVLMEQDFNVAPVGADVSDTELVLRIEDYEKQLAKSENAITAYQAKEAEPPAVQLSTVSREVEQADALRRVENELGVARARSTDLLNQLSATVPTEVAIELARWRVKLAGLRSRHPGEHPDILTALARISQLERSNAALLTDPGYAQLQTELQTALDEVEVLKANRSSLRAAPAALPEASNTTPVAQAELQSLIDEQRELKTVYEELISQRDQSSVNASPANAVSYQVFERPEAALSPSGPPRLSLILGGFLLAVVTGFSASAVMTALDKSFSSSAELKKAIDLPVLGSVGTAPSAAVTAFNRRDRVRLIAACGALFMVGVGYIYIAVFQSPTVATSSIALMDGRAGTPSINGGWRV